MSSPYFDLSFNPDKLARTTTRTQWRDMHRWLRTCRAIIRKRFAQNWGSAR